MEFEIGDFEELEESKNMEEDSGSFYEKLSESSLIPSVGLYLGLDISEGSTGLTLYENGEKLSTNISLTVSDKEEFVEVKRRRELKEKIAEYVKGKSFNLIIVEDAFQGVNPRVTRLLYALNTSIDELILDGVCSCEKFKRVSNGTWKSWLFSIDTEGLFVGMKDKPRIQKCLEMLGVYEKGEGFQDRLDSCGMLLGYFLCKNDILEKEEVHKKKRVSFSDIEYDYQEDDDLVVYNSRQGRDTIYRRSVKEKRWSKEKMINYLTENPSEVHVTEDEVLLGNLGVSLGLPYLPNGGFFAFWVKPKRLKKYMED